MNKLVISWKTSLAGVAAVLAGLSGAVHLIQIKNWNFGDPAWTTAIGGIVTGAGLIFARDHNVTSEQAGLKMPDKPTVIVDAFRKP